MSPPRDAPLVLAIDLGSSGVRVAAVDPEGHSHGSATRPLPMHFGPGGAAEEDPEEIWQALGDAIVDALGRAPGTADRVVAMLCDSQFSSLVPVDAAGLPVGPMLLYLDGRGGPPSRALTKRRPELWQLWIERHGMPSPGGGSDSLAHWLWFESERPEIHARTHAYVEPSDYVTGRLTGRVTANVCTLFPLLLTDNRRGSEGGWCEELIEAAGIDRSRLPELVPPDSVVGELRPEHAKAWGLPPGVKVFTGINDTQALAYGTGSQEGSRLGISIGTTLVATTLTESMRSDLSHFLLTQPAALPGRHLLMAEGGLAGKALDFVLQQLIYARDRLGDHHAADPFARLDEAVRAVPEGADGVVFLPWLVGVWSPVGDERARGAFLNLGLDTSRPHLVRAVLEGIACQLAWLLPPIEALTGRHHDELVFAAGGAESDAWAQILADVCNRPVHRVAEPRLTNCRGSALLAFHHLGLLDLDDAARELSVQRSYRPRPEHRALYDDRVERFILAHERLGPLFPRPAPEAGHKEDPHDR